MRVERKAAEHVFVLLNGSTGPGFLCSVSWGKHCWRHVLIAQSVEMLAASHETEALRQSVLLYAKVGCKIESSEEASVFKIVEVLKHFFRQRALSLVREAGHQPLLYVYAANATSLLCRSESQSMLEGSLVRSADAHSWSF